MSSRTLSTRAWEEAMTQLRAAQPHAMATWLRGHLFDHVLPFWEPLLEPDQRGLLTCVSETGAVQSTDKWLWSQWRAVWVLSRIHRTLDPDPKWLARARGIADFCLESGWLGAEAGWALVLDAEGRVQRGGESIYTDAFAAYGLGELFRASGKTRYRDWACRTADAALVRLARPYDQLPHFPYAIPAGAKPHGVPMIWSLTFADLAAAVGEPRYLDQAVRFSQEIFRDFYRPERDVVLEFVTADGSTLPGPQGSVVVPGHTIEDMWFQLHVTEASGGDAELEALALRLILRHLELGWDPPYGGIRLAIDSEGHEPVAWNLPEAKLWWPQTEALYATLLAWTRTRDKRYLDWYEQTWRLCLDHYVDWEHGEWRQRLNRDLSPMAGIVALPVKDPFHLPRALILQIELLERLERADPRPPAARA